MAVRETAERSSRISVSGRYRASLLARFEEELEGAGHARLPHVVVDLSALESADAAALDALLGRWSRFNGDGVQLILVRVPKHLRVPLEETGLDRLLPVAYDGSLERY